MEDRKSQKREDNGKSAQHQLEGAVFHFNVSQGMDSIRGSVEVTIRCFRCATSLVAFCLCSLTKMMMTTRVQALLVLHKTYNTRLHLKNSVKRYLVGLLASEQFRQ